MTERKSMMIQEGKQMIYCVEDEDNIRELIVYTLQTTGFSARGFSRGQEMISALSACKPELILLDIMLPGEDGMRLLKRLKENTQTRDIPVIMVTAKGSEYDKVMGLDAGADDYIAKPFGMMEFVARVKAVLRRRDNGRKEREFVYGGLRLLVDRHTVQADGQEITVTLKEFELLRCLLENVGIVLTRDRLLEQVWGYDFNGETRTVDVHIRTLRQKLGTYGNAIETVRGVGYRVPARPDEVGL